MDLQIVAGSFSDTTVKVVPASDAGQKFLGFATEQVIIRKSNLATAIRAAEAQGLVISRC